MRFLVFLLSVVIISPVSARGDRPWPPKPADLIHLYLRSDDKGTKILGGQGVNQLVEVFQVPADRWLIITDVQGRGGDGLSVYEGRNSTKQGRVVIAGTPPVYSSSVGVAFHPGSTVIINRGCDEIIITGYLSDP